MDSEGHRKMAKQWLCDHPSLWDRIKIAVRADGIAQGRREAAAAVRAKRLAGPDGLQMFKSNFNSGIDVAIDAILEGEGVER
jgi:hypothetical protein